jgi:hypothetical protein
MTTYRDISENFSQGYGVFPYIIIREWHGVYRQVPITIRSIDEHQSKMKYTVENTNSSTNDSKELMKDEHFIESLKNLALLAHQDYKKRSCLVLSPGRCLYFEDGSVVEVSKSIPAGGKLLDISNETIGHGGIHHKIPIVYRSSL